MTFNKKVTPETSACGRFKLAHMPPLSAAPGGNVGGVVMLQAKPGAGPWAQCDFSAGSPCKDCAAAIEAEAKPKALPEYARCLQCNPLSAIDIQRNDSSAMRKHIGVCKKVGTPGHLRFLHEEGAVTERPPAAWKKRPTPAAAASKRKIICKKRTGCPGSIMSKSKSRVKCKVCAANGGCTFCHGKWDCDVCAVRIAKCKC